MEKFRLEKLNETRQEAKNNGHKLTIVISVYIERSNISVMQITCTSIETRGRFLFFWNDDVISCSMNKKDFNLKYSFCDDKAIFYELCL